MKQCTSKIIKNLCNKNMKYYFIIDNFNNKIMDLRFDEQKYFQPYRAQHDRDPYARWRESQAYFQEIDQMLNLSNNYLKGGSPLRKLERSASHLLKSSNTNVKKSYANRGETGNTRRRLVWDELYEKGIDQRKKIQEKHKEKEDKVDEQCTFKPILRGKSERYIVNNQFDFIERNNIWVQNKIVKIVKEKEQLTNLDLKQCTFSPQINKTNKSSRYLKQRTSKNHNNINPNKSSLILKSKGTLKNRIQEVKKEKIPYDQAKNKIRKQLQNILF